MKQITSLKRVLIALLVTVLVMSAGASTALASSTDTVSDDDASDITINGLDVGLEDTHLAGEGLPHIDIEDRTYTIDERSVTIDGLTMTVNDAEIGIDDLTVTVEDSTLELHNVTVGEA